MSEPRIIIKEVTDPDEIARAQAQHERARRNSDWLQAHWPELAPLARGRHLAVAGQEAFIAGTGEEAWAMAQAAHPDDDGALLQYVRAERGPPASLRIVGGWLVCDDGITRPVIVARVPRAIGGTQSDRFLVDSGADRSVFGAHLWRRLHVVGQRPSAGNPLLGVGGGAAFVLVRT